ncbi:MAG: LacI family transcriptional regulator [Firmicutes bacterium]|nr:LacI family transcriptional regulator [Bacillota bacterium]
MVATIKNVAAEASVSPSTVSRVITGKAPVSSDKREKVLAAIKKLNYRPNILARGLKSKETKTLGLILPNITNPFFAEVAKGVEDAADAAGYNVILCNAGDDGAKEIRYLEVLHKKWVDGIVYDTVGVDTVDYLRTIMGDGIPIVTMDREIKGLPVDAVCLDNVKGGYIATRYLIALGHRKIALIAGPVYISTTTDREEGYRRALDEVGIQPRPDFIRYFSYDFESGFNAAAELLSFDDPPTGFICANDMIALGVIQQLERKGFQVPMDFSVVGFDDIYVSRLVKPALTTIAQPKYEMGQKAVALLLEHIARKRKRPKTALFAPELVIRESCGEQVRK